MSTVTSVLTALSQHVLQDHQGRDLVPPYLTIFSYVLTPNAFIHIHALCVLTSLNDCSCLSFPLTQAIAFRGGFPGGSEVKASACNVGDLGSIPGSGRSPGQGNGNSPQYSSLENPMGGGAMVLSQPMIDFMSPNPFVSSSACFPHLHVLRAGSFQGMCRVMGLKKWEEDSLGGR